jgi:hypothetical protein
VAPPYEWLVSFSVQSLHASSSVGGGARHGWYFRGRVELAIYTIRAGIPRARRSESRLYASVLTGLICTHSLRISVVLACASLGAQSQNACKLGVSCRVNRRYHVHWLIETSFGPAYEADIDASDGFHNPNPPFLLLRRVPPAIRRLRTRVILLLTTIVASLTRTTPVERPFFD